MRIMCGVLLLLAACPDDSKKPPDYNLIWTFVNNTATPTDMLGEDEAALHAQCDSGPCLAQTPSVHLVANESAATSSFGPGDAYTMTNVTAIVQRGAEGLPNVEGTANNIPVASLTVTSLTATWDGTNVSINVSH